MLNFLLESSKLLSLLSRYFVVLPFNFLLFFTLDINIFIVFFVSKVVYFKTRPKLLDHYFCVDKCILVKLLEWVNHFSGDYTDFPSRFTMRSMTRPNFQMLFIPIQMRLNPSSNFTHVSKSIVVSALYISEHFSLGGRDGKYRHL